MATKKLCAAADCDKPFYCRGYCLAHYRRVMSYGDPLATAVSSRRSFLEMALKHERDECLLWPYGKGKHGYGMMRYDGRQQTVPRIICKSLYGEPEGKMDARHSCGVRACVNPRHLSWGTRKQNMQDKLAHGTAPRGTNNAHCKITDSDVRWIREFGANMPRKDVAAMFGVSRHQIGAIVLRRAWTWLE